MIPLAGCAGPEGVEIPADPAPVELPPSIDEALTDRCDPAPTPPPTGDDLHRVTLSDPLALCNDGSPGVLYVRAGDPEHAADWALYLDGGRYCEDHETCAARWCHEAFYDASWMSSRWEPETRAAPGLQGRDPRNPFRGWNQVFFHYCSSDRWTGTRADAVPAGDPPYRLHFLGDAILDAGLGALAAGVSSDDGAATLPSLDDADRVVLTGSSAGAHGVAAQLDAVAERLAGAEVKGVLDALFDLDRDLVDPALADVVAAELQADHLRHDALWHDVQDASCEAAGLGWECVDHGVLLRDQLSTPFLLHHDLADPDIYDLDYGPLGLSRDEYLRAGLDTFARWEAEDVGGSFLLTGCAVHTYLSSDARFLAFSTADADGGAPVTLAEAVEGFVGDAPVRISDDASLTGSACP